jgi:hypothetical protein
VVLGNPVTVLGADYWYSEPATLSSVTVQIIQQGDRFRYPTVGSLAIAGYAPELRFDYRFTPESGELGVEASTVLWTQDYTLDPVQTTVSLTGYAPQVLLGSRSIEPVTGQLGVTGHVPTLLERPLIVPETGQLGIQGWDVTFLIGPAAILADSALEITGYAPSLEIKLVAGPQDASLGITGYAPGIQIVPATVVGTLSSVEASLTGTVKVVIPVTAALQSPQPLAFNASVTEKVPGTGSLLSGRASLQGSVYPVIGHLDSGPATMFGHGTVERFEPTGRRIKPVRVNRYTVVLKPSPRKRLHRPNTRRPQK